jgi:hypothetical protein
MRAKEFISERILPKRKNGPMVATYTFPTMPSADPYQAYRFAMAMANHDILHKDGPTSRNAVMVAYTPEEEQIIRAGEKVTGHKASLVADKKSSEPESTNKISPVAKLKRNAYGV